MPYPTPSTSTSSGSDKPKAKRKAKLKSEMKHNRRKGDKKEHDPNMEKMYSKLDL